MSYLNDLRFLLKNTAKAETKIINTVRIGADGISEIAFDCRLIEKLNWFWLSTSQVWVSRAYVETFTCMVDKLKL